MGRPLLLEGEPGVGKTEIARVLARVLGRELIRLQCFEGLDAGQALYEWDYPKQLLRVRAAEAEGRAVGDLYDEEFLLQRPLLRAVRSADGAVLLIDEIDRGGQRVRGVPAGVPRRLPDHDPGARHDPRRAAAGGRADLEPHPRAARRAQAPLPLPLDRVPGRRARAADPARARAGARRGGRGRAGARRSRACARCRCSSGPASPRRSTGPGAPPRSSTAAARGRTRCAARSGCSSRTRRTSTAVLEHGLR